LVPAPFTTEEFERLFYGLFNTTRASVLIIDRGFRVLAANRNFLSKSRRSEEETVGARLEEVFPPVLLHYIGLAEKVRTAFRNALFSSEGQMTYRAPSVPLRIYYYLLTPIANRHGATSYVMLLMYDITEEQRLSGEVQRAERHLASVVQSAGDLVVSLDPEERILSWNPAAERISHYRWDEIIHRPLRTLCSEESQETMHRAVKRLVLGGTTESLEADLLTKDGRRVPVAWALSGMQDENGVVTAIVAVGRDLTLRRQFEAQLIQSAKMSSLGVMAGGIAHEIRNPLGICSAAAQLMVEMPDDHVLQQECAHRIHENIKRAALVIDNLLKFARPPEEQYLPVDLNRIVDASLALVANQARTQHIRVQFHPNPQIPLIMGNANLLQQVFTNLLLNACQSMTKGGDLEVVASLIGEWVSIQFADTGIGIDPDEIDRIFDPFFTTRPVGQGTGLGLPISYSIVRQHGGRIEVQSAVGKGSKFTIYLPVRQPGGQHGLFQTDHRD
jgi:PAS domain S-box-containing protein